MQITHQRDMQMHALMVSLEKEENPAEYVLHMLEKQPIPGLLSCQVQKEDNCVRLRYDITSAISMKEIYEGKGMREEDVRFWLAEARDVLASAEKYLLPLELISFSPGIIFLKGTRSGFCLCPGKKTSLSEEITGFLEFIIAHLEHSDQRIVKQVYEIYGRIRRGEENWNELLELCAGREEEMIQQDKEKEERLPDVVETKKERISIFFYIRIGLFVAAATFLFLYIRETLPLFYPYDLLFGIGSGGVIAGMLFLYYRLLRKEKRNDPGEHTEKMNKKETKRWNFRKKECREKPETKERRIEESKTEKRTIEEEKEALKKIPEDPVDSRRRLTERMTQNTERGRWSYANLWEENSRPQEQAEEIRMETEIPKKEEQKPMKEEPARPLPKKKEVSMEKEQTKTWLGDTRPLDFCGIRLPALAAAEKEGIRFLLADEVVVVGKIPPQAQMILHSAGVSRIHAKLEHRGDGYCIVDLFSTNGTYVNGERLEPGKKKYLEYGDTIRFANENFVYQEAEVTAEKQNGMDKSWEGIWCNRCENRKNTVN